MSQASATERALQLKAVLNKWGVAATVELKAGRAWTGDDWYSHKHVVMNHHTAGSANGLTPSYALCRNGTSTLPGPLCNGYGGRDFVYRIITMGLGNHPGAGGPLTVAGFTIPYNSARISCWGTEWEHVGTTEWNEDMRLFMARSNAALNEFWAIPIQRQIEHSTWAPSRKIDRKYYNAVRGQGEILSVIGGGTPGGPAPAPVVVPPPKTVWRRGDTGLTVNHIQWRLSVHGFPTVMDQDFGPGTEANVIAFQRSRNLDPDGAVGPITFTALNAEPAGRQPSEVSRNTQRAVRLPDDGYWGPQTDQGVNAIRSALNGQFPWGVRYAQTRCGTASDGAWGPASKAALRTTVARLQGAWGAGADGLWGPQTEAAWVRARSENWVG